VGVGVSVGGVGVGVGAGVCDKCDFFLKKREFGMGFWI
jgi:hypothetical protein